MYAKKGGCVVGVVYKDAESGGGWLTKEEEIVRWREEYVLRIYVINIKDLPPFDSSV